MATRTFRYKEKLTCLFEPGTADNALGKLAANFPELDLVWGDGTGDNKINGWWCDLERAVASGANDDLDLTALAAAGSPDGAALNLAEVRAIFIFADDDNTTVLTMQPGASNGWTALGASFSLGLKAQAKYRLLCPDDGAWPTSGTDKVLRIGNASGATANYGILILGCRS